jgi:WD40 repeat protein
MKARVLFVSLTLLLVSLAGLSRSGYGQQFSDWTAPVNLGPPVDTVGVEGQPAISRDGLSLYFTLMEDDGSQDIWVAKRISLTDSWGKMTSTCRSAGTVRRTFRPILPAGGCRRSTWGVE